MKEFMRKDLYTRIYFIVLLIIIAVELIIGEVILFTRPLSKLVGISLLYRMLKSDELSLSDGQRTSLRLGILCGVFLIILDCYKLFS